MCTSDDPCMKTPEQNRADFEKSLEIWRESSKREIEARGRARNAEPLSLDHCLAEIDAQRWLIKSAEAGILGYPFTCGVEYDARVQLKIRAEESLERLRCRVKSLFPEADI